MLKRQILRDINQVCNASLNEIHFLNVDKEDIKTNQKWPTLLANAKQSTISQNKEIKTFEVSILMLMPMPVRVFGISDVAFEQMISDEQDSMADVVEEIIYILTSNDFNFPYDLASDAEFEYESNYTDYGLNACQVVFNVSAKSSKKCCSNFNLELLQ